MFLFRKNFLLFRSWKFLILLCGIFFFYPCGMKGKTGGPGITMIWTTDPWDLGKDAVDLDLGQDQIHFLLYHLLYCLQDQSLDLFFIIVLILQTKAFSMDLYIPDIQNLRTTLWGMILVFVLWTQLIEGVSNIIISFREVLLLEFLLFLILWLLHNLRQLLSWI